jgi:hypothetical protein
MKRLFSLVIVLVAVGGFATAFGVSEGNYDPARMHCSGRAERAIEPDYVEDGCHNFTITISDGKGHEYFGIGSPQTKDGERGGLPSVLPFGIGANVHQLDWWYDLGDGCTRFSADSETPGAPVQDACPWFNPTAPNYYGPSKPVEPGSGLKIYFGADDNLAGGEHDSSYLVNNGPSDGGGIRVELRPGKLAGWIRNFMAHPRRIGTHPLPVADAGIGFCADGICFSIQTARRAVFQGGSTGESRAVSNYDGKNWDPEECSGANDANTTDCDDPSTSGTEDITYWNDQEGTVYAEPGVQIYEDPDAQGSPIGPYPLPAIYVGACGVVIGGGPMQMPDSPFTNDAGQIVIPAGCK